jgi:signal transduction histidine kinase
MTERSFYAPEQLVPKLGETLVNMGLLNEVSLKIALKAQKEQPKYANVLLGEVLIDLNLINQQTLNAAITEQIYLLKSQLLKSNQDLEQRVQQRTIELQNALTKLAELSQMKANFISNISHELRTPLTHIIGYLELIDNQDLGPLTSNQQAATRTMIRSSSQLEKLINDLIMFTSIENENIKLHLQNIDLSVLFESVVIKSMPFANQHAIKLTQNISETAKFVVADQDKLQWVIIQLVENAVKFSPKGGKVTLSSQAEGLQVRISITDNGIGISTNQFERIFDPFYQIDGSTTRKYGGTGMGLSLVKKILLLHKSEIRVKSKENMGSEFSFLLQKPL